MESIFNQKKSGSGYEDLKGSVINYGYNNFDDFNLVVYNNKIKWQGQKAYFANITKEVVPIISLVDKGIYFLSWATSVGSDNIVMNLNTMKIYAHSYMGSTDNLILSVYGNIYSINAEESICPHGEITESYDITSIKNKNIQEKKLVSIDNLIKSMKSLNDDIAIKELQSKVVKFNSEHSNIQITILNKTIKVKDNENINEFPATATKISEGIYFISCESENSKYHIVINENTMKVFTHATSAGEKREGIYALLKYV